MQELYMCGHLDNTTGYGQLNCQFLKGFQEQGINVSVFPTGLSERGEKLPEYVRQSIVATPELKRATFLIQPPMFRVDNKSTNRVWFILWEATRFDPRWVKNIDQSQAVVVASDWNASALSACNVDTNIYKVPLFVTPDFSWQEYRPKNKYVFGCSGHLSGQAVRKNLNAVVEAFEQAFPRTQDVELQIKIGEFDHVHVPDDKRIVIIKGHLPQNEMVRWYANLNVFVHASKAEGWGFQPLQAMAVGRPVIACRYGGVAEYFDSRFGLETEFTFQPAREMYENYGHWAEPTHDSLVDNMLWAYQHPAQMDRLGFAAVTRAHQFTPQKTLAQLTKILQKHEIITTT